jgi:NAD(P)-dependent dehydrogenase (short-subunit alcohol dehydrogenase family)
MVSQAVVLQDPRSAGPKPPFRQQRQDPPGQEAAMDPQPDHGETTYQGSGRLQGMGTLITGADSGIGRAVALAFAREGANVVIAYLNEEEDAQRTAQLVRQAGRQAITLHGDVREESHCRQLVASAYQHFGRLDVLVNNAAFQATQQEIEDISAEQFDRTFRTNVYSMFYLCKAALSGMNPGASIINTASIQGFEPAASLLDYASSKSAIIGFTKALAKMVASRGIRVNAVAPGPVWTPLIPSTMPRDNIQDFGKSSVFGRAAQPAELAPIYVLLASPEATYVTGEVYGATGGRMPL